MNNKATKSNIFLFFGEDDFSLRRKIELWKTEFAKKYSPQAISFVDAASVSEVELIKLLESQLAPSLFSSKKLIIIRDALPTKASQTALAEFILKLPSAVDKDIVVFWQTSKPDGRLGFTKKFLASDISVTEFKLPHGPILNAWIEAMAKNLGVAISKEAAELLARYLGRDMYEEKKIGGRVVESKEAFDLWLAYSELSKLASNTDQISVETIQSLVRPKLPDSVFILSDNLAAKNTKAAISALENYLSTASGDEKSAMIKVIGLLSEQFRSLLLVSDLASKGMDQQAIADKLGWSNGRVFVLTKHSRNFSPSVLVSLLRQLLVIDYKIKSSDINPHLLLDLLISKAG